MTFPKDVKVVFEDWKSSKGPKNQAALDDAANYVRSILHGVVKQDAHDPAYLHYSDPMGQAQTYAKDLIQHEIKKKWTLTGTDKFFHPHVKMTTGNQRAVVTFCEDQAKIFNKEVKTEKQVPTGEGVNRYLSYTVIMDPVPDVDGIWWAEEVDVKDGTGKCAH